MKKGYFSQILVLFLLLAVFVQCDKDDSQQDQAHVYVAGIDITGLCEKYPALWKNRVPSHLSAKSSITMVNSVYVSDSAVYVAGHIGNFAKVWKNGIATDLSDGTELADARSVFVSGSDVYVAGNIFKQGILWKNGVATNLSDVATNGSAAYSVFVTSE